jgi:hypothetical protein
MAVEYDIDVRERPECDRRRAGEQGVSKGLPYKDELLPRWGVKDEETAEAAKRPPRQWADPDKRAAAVVFRKAWRAVTDDPASQRRKDRHRAEVYDPAASPMTD